jgi:hypothetical protein
MLHCSVPDAAVANNATEIACSATLSDQQMAAHAKRAVNCAVVQPCQLACTSLTGAHGPYANFRFHPYRRFR